MAKKKKVVTKKINKKINKSANQNINSDVTSNITMDDIKKISNVSIEDTNKEFISVLTALTNTTANITAKTNSQIASLTSDVSKIIKNNEGDATVKQLQNNFLTSVKKAIESNIENETDKNIKNIISKLNLSDDSIQDAIKVQSELFKLNKQATVDFNTLLTGIKTEKSNREELEKERVKNFKSTIISISKKLLAATDEYYTKIQDVYKSTGYLTNQLTGIANTTADIYINNLKWGVSQDQILQTVNDLTSAYGSLRGYNKDVLAQASELEGKYAISGSSLANVSLYLESAGKSSKDLKKYVEGTVKAISKNDGTSLKENMEAIANASDDTLAFLGNSPEQLAKAVSHAKELHLEISDMASISSGLLSLESSISNQMSANVLSGKNMNFEKARELALRGKISDATDLMLKQVGSISEFNNLNYYQQKSIATATGMSIKQLRTSLTLKEKEYNMSEAQRKQQDTINMGVTQLKNIWSNLKKSIFIPLIPMFEQLNALILDMGNNDMSSLKTVLTYIKDIVQGLATPISMILASIRALTTDYSLKDFWGDFAGDTHKVIASVSGLIISLVVGVKLFSKLKTSLSGMFKIFKLFKKSGNIIDTVVPSKNKIMTIDKSTTSVMTSIKKFVKDVIKIGKSLVNAIVNIGKKIINGIVSIGKSASRGLVSIVKIIAKGVVSGLKIVLDGIATGLVSFFEILSGVSMNPAVWASIGLLTAISLNIMMIAKSIQWLSPLLITVAKIIGDVLMTAIKEIPDIIMATANGFTIVTASIINLIKAGPGLLLLVPILGALAVTIGALGLATKLMSKNSVHLFDSLSSLAFNSEKLKSIPNDMKEITNSFKDLNSNKIDFKNISSGFISFAKAINILSESLNNLHNKLSILKSKKVNLVSYTANFVKSIFSSSDNIDNTDNAINLDSESKDIEELGASVNKIKIRDNSNIKNKLSSNSNSFNNSSIEALLKDLITAVKSDKITNINIDGRTIVKAIAKTSQSNGIG